VTEALDFTRTHTVVIYLALASVLLLVAPLFASYVVDGVVRVARGQGGRTLVGALLGTALIAAIVLVLHALAAAAATASDHLVRDATDWWLLAAPVLVLLSVLAGVARMAREHRRRWSPR
jgi:hypothetical protein